jgi:hypothetical protein
METEMVNIEDNFFIRKSTRKNKKYDIFEKKDKNEDGYWYVLSFGDSRYQQYFDSTPLKSFSHLNHYDIRRKGNYHKRHGISKNKRSAKYWSNKYLW